MDILELEGWREGLASLPAGVTEAEADLERQCCTLIGVSCGKICRTDWSDHLSIYVRASSDRTGYAYSENRAEDPGALIRLAAENAHCAEQPGRDPMADPLPAPEAPYVTGEEADLEDLKKAAAALERAALAHPSITAAQAEVREDLFQSRVLNSKGFNRASSRRVWSAGLLVTAEAAGETYNAESLGSALRLSDLDLNALAQLAAERAVRQFSPHQLETGVYPAILAPSVCVNIMTTAWQLFSGPKYAQGATALAGFLGERVGADALTILDTPAHPGTGYRFPFDCEGVSGGTQTLVDRGRLTGLLHNLESAGRLGAAPTGNAGRVALLSGNIPTDIIVTPRICHIAPGSATADALFAHLDRGVCVTESYDVFHSINIGSGDFSIPCKAVWVEGGRPVRALAGLSISGNLRDLFASVEEVGSDLEITEFLKKSYCVGSPSLRLRALQVNGKESVSETR